MPICDPGSKLASLIDANSNTTTFSYDGLDRLSLTTYPLGTTQALTYDADSNILTQTTRAGEQVIFTYDTLNRVATKTATAYTPITYALCQPLRRKLLSCLRATRFEIIRSGRVPAGPGSRLRPKPASCLGPGG